MNQIGNNTDAYVSGAAMPIASAAAENSQSQPKSARRMGPARKAAVYLASAFALTAAMLGVIVDANRRYAPEYYQPSYMTRVADAFSSGRNYAVFDLNINIRKLREEQFKRLEKKPSLVIFGASQWQEAGSNLLVDRKFINSHIHRDYYEDVLGMADLLVRNNKLPSDLVITIRDRLFTPVDKRTDFLWLPGVSYYQAMAARLAVPPLGYWEAYPLQRLRELASLSMLFSNATRWHNAKDLPRATAQDHVATLDVLHPDGSITWSDEHRAIFTQERSRKLAIAHADASRARPPLIDPKGVEALDRLLAYLSLRGVRVHLAHPPFNPVFFARVQNTPYMDGLREVEAVTRELAEKHKLNLVGGFDPGPLGCTAEMFIDAEHSGAPCLRSLLADVANSVDLPVLELPQGTFAEARAKQRSTLTVMASGWTASERSVPNETAPVVPAFYTSLRETPADEPEQPLERTANALEARPEPTAQPEAEVEAEAEARPETAAAAPVAREPTRAPELTPAYDATAAAAPSVDAKDAKPGALGEPLDAKRRAVSARRVSGPLRLAKHEPARRPAHARRVTVSQTLVWPGDAPVRRR